MTHASILAESAEGCGDDDGPDAHVDVGVDANHDDVEMEGHRSAGYSGPG